MRKCGECTLCCTLLQLNEIASKIGETCRYCDKGCTIYNIRPQECRQYECMWLQMDEVAEELRPDKLGVIFDRAGKDVISARIGEDDEMPELALRQIESFGREGFSVVVFKGNTYKGYLHPKHTKQYVMDTIRGRAYLH